jgi:hypothetical protein
METLYQGQKDVFLAKVRADFDKIEDQALKASKALKAYSLLGTDAMGDTMFTSVSETGDDGDRVVWRHIGVTGAKDLGTRRAGGAYPETEFIRNYETAVYDPDNQNAGTFILPDERAKKEGTRYRSTLSRAQKLLIEIDRLNMKDPFEVFNLAFSAPSSLPTTGAGGGRFFVRGNMGLDGNNTALGERLVSIQHARADGGATQSNAVQDSGNARAFGDDAYWAAREQGATFKDDVGKEMPMFGGALTIVIPPANGLVRSAKEIAGSDLVVNSMENQINVHKGTFTSIVSSPFLLASSYVSGVANTNQWFLVDTSSRDTETGLGLMCVQFVPLETNLERVQGHDAAQYTVKQEKSYGWIDWRNVIASKGDAAAYSA